jgi:hypothetical protein
MLGTVWQTTCGKQLVANNLAGEQSGWRTIWLASNLASEQSGWRTIWLVNNLAKKLGHKLGLSGDHWALEFLLGEPQSGSQSQPQQRQY